MLRVGAGPGLAQVATGGLRVTALGRAGAGWTGLVHGDEADGLCYGHF